MAYGFTDPNQATAPAAPVAAPAAGSGRYVFQGPDGAWYDAQSYQQLAPAGSSPDPSWQISPITAHGSGMGQNVQDPTAGLTPVNQFGVYGAPGGQQAYADKSGALYDQTGKMIAGPDNSLLAKAGNAAGYVVTEGNPVAGTFNAVNDAAHGNFRGAAADFGAGATFGTIDPNRTNGTVLDKAGAAAINTAGNLAGVSGPSVGGGGSLLGGLPGLGGLGGGSIDSGSLASDLQSTRDTRNSFQQQLANYQPRDAPQIQAAQLGPANTISAPTLGPAGQTQASLAGPVERVSSSSIAAPTLGSAAQVGAPTLGRAQTAGVSNAQQTSIAPNERAGYQTYGGATVNTADEAAIRARQGQLLDKLQAYANGTGGPSAAEILLQQQTERNLAQQYALAQTAQGSNIGAAQRQASLTAGDLNAQATAQGAALRAQEQATARQQLASALSDVRGADLGLATTQAGFQQQAGLSNQSAFNQAAQFNAGQTNQRNEQQAGLTQGVNLANAAAANQVGMFNAGQGNDFAKAQAAMALQAGLANQSANNQFTLTGADMGLRASLANQSTGLQAAMANQSAYNQNQQFNAGQTQQANIFNTGQANDFTKAQAQLVFQAAAANQDALNQFQIQQATLGQQAAIANLDATLKARGLDDAMRQQLMQDVISSNKDVITGDVGAMGAQAAALGAKMSLISGLAGAGATIFG